LFKKGHVPKNKKSLDEVLIENSFYCKVHLKRRLIENGRLKNSCYVCGLSPEWNGSKLVLVMDHINGVNSDNRIENLRLLCPNCNSQQSTFAAKNKKKANYSCTKCGKKLKADRSTGLCMGCISERKNEKTKRVRVKKLIVPFFCSVCSKEITKSSKTGKCFDCAMLSIRKEKKRYNCVVCGKETISKSKKGTCFNCYAKNRRLVARPTFSVLQSQIAELGYCGTARLYGVSDNAIRKWVKVYEKGN
jgi:Zn finger protein HypA/HybF involved in hydrogenase expression